MGALPKVEAEDREDLGAKVEVEDREDRDAKVEVEVPEVRDTMVRVVGHDDVLYESEDLNNHES